MLRFDDCRWFTDRVAAVDIIDWGEALEDAAFGVGLAYLAEGIRIDGDLSDWPAAPPRYPLTIAAFGRPRNAEE